MAKYFFHIRRGDAVFVDPRGFNASTLDYAVRRAAKYVRETMRDEPDIPSSSQCIEIVDAQGTVIRMIAFEAVPQAA